MNTKFIMEILGNPQSYSADQRKIAISAALELLDDIALREGDAQLGNTADEEGAADCEHDWVSADNEVVSGCSICTKCKSVIATAKL